MKTHWTPACAGLVLATLLSGSSMTTEDRNEGLGHLASTRAALWTATEGLTEAQWRFKPGPGRWSIAEIVEHLALAEDFFYMHVTENVMSGPKPEPGRDFAGLDKLIAETVPDRANKATAPPPLEPSGRWTGPEALAELKRLRQRSMTFLANAKGLRDHVLDSPFGQPMDGRQWLLFCSAHTARHTAQVMEVKASPGFPGPSGE